MSHFLLVSGTAAKHNEGLQMHAKNPITRSVTGPDPVKLGGEVQRLYLVVEMHIKKKSCGVKGLPLRAEKVRLLNSLGFKMQSEQI